MKNDRWRMGFHLMPPVGWLNDPNGLCFFRGAYHVFHQYSPQWPQDNKRSWGHASSTDLMSWHHHGVAITHDSAADANGVFSGCAYVAPGAASDGCDLLLVYYTGNVKENGTHDYIYEGRQANQILVTSEDTLDFSSKRVLLCNEDYPAYCSCHVRDPYVYKAEDDEYAMLLGARSMDDEGFILVYRSFDGINWTFSHDIRCDKPLGYMWECPNRISLNGTEYLACCPQGSEDLYKKTGMHEQAGYFVLAADKRVCDVFWVQKDSFVLWDEGFDFYAPQVFTDGIGRRILIGWMRNAETPHQGVPEGMEWTHCLTVPRVLSRTKDGKIAQLPVAELAGLRGHEVSCSGGQALLDEHRADLEITGIEGPFSLELDGGLVFSCANGHCSLSLSDDIGAGRTKREVYTGVVRDLRVLIDSSTVEIFINDGATVFSTRWFPASEKLEISADGRYKELHLWPMGDGMAATYRR